MLTVEVHESWYGETEGRGKDTWLWVLLGPSVISQDVKVSMGLSPERKLVIKGLTLPVQGKAVVETTRRIAVEPDQATSQVRADDGPPEAVWRVTYNPNPDDGGTWRETVQGLWPIRVVKVRRKSAWDRLR